MKSFSKISVLIFLVFAGGVSSVRSQGLDISSGGMPTITGSSGGSVVGSSSVLNNLTVTINFGEVSPVNINSIVKVVVPIAVRSREPYRVEALVTGSTNANPQAMQRTDIGFGVNNFRAMGSGARDCTNSTHDFVPPFNNDPSITRTIDGTGRAAYPSTINNLGTATTILTGPRLSDGIGQRRTDDGYVFDAILAITPQFYATSSADAVITFTISPGPPAPC
jgi:hypothetical protein